MSVKERANIATERLRNHYARQLCHEKAKAILARLLYPRLAPSAIHGAR